MRPANEFDIHVSGWKEEQATPWGRLNTSTRRLNLDRHLAGYLNYRPLRVLDVGGGNGDDSVWLAGRGHRVTLLDCSPVMLEEARAGAEAAGVLDNLRLVEGDASALPHLFEGEQFDVVLCHMVLEFVPDPPALLPALVERLGRGGLLSIISTNRYSEVYRWAMPQGDLRAALAAVGLEHYQHPWVDRLVLRYSADQLVDPLAALGCELAGNYGILAVCAYLPNERKGEPEFFADLERLEHALSATYPYYLLARYFHLIFRRL